MSGQKLEPSLTTFEELVGEKFSVQSGDQLIRFALKQVSKLPPATARTDLGIRQEPFSLLFEVVTNFQPDQGTFSFNTEAGSIDLFLVPVGFGDYEAIFN